VSVPAALDALVLACLDKDPALRPQTADEVSARLRACRTEPWSREDAHRWWADHHPGDAVATDRQTND
jgi:hypothetical protein